MNTDDDEVLLQVRVRPELLRALDHWRIDQRMTRKEAVCKLLLFACLQLGIEVEKEEAVDKQSAFPS